ncbi:MAG: energy transducer TonB [Pseudomonadota bacterium]
MSYAQKKEISGNRTAAIIMVVVIQFALGYAIVTGLAYNVIKKAAEDLKTFNVEEEPPPPEPPPPPKDMPDLPPPPTTPPPLVQMNAPAPTIQIQVAPPPMIPPVAPQPPPPPPAPRKVSAAKAKGSLLGLFSDEDYPASAQAAGAEGTAQASLTIGADGRVSGCNITRSTGNGALDAATCSILRRRAKFSPAIDSNGKPTSDTVSTPPITWRLEG